MNIGACLVLVITVLAFASVGKAETRRTLWQIGTFDGNGRELAGWPQGAHRVPDWAPDGRLVYTIGESSPSRWPFIHPAKADTAWAPAGVYRYVVRFVEQSPQRGILLLRIALEDTHESLASTMHVRLNGGAESTRRLPLGRGRLYYGDPHGRPSELLIPLDSKDLRAGINELEIWLTDGSWCAYDALALIEMPALSDLPRRLSPRTHGMTANLLPLHNEGSLDMLDARGMVAALQAGWLKLVGIEDGATAVLRQALADGLMKVEFDVLILEGSLTVAAEAPHGYGPSWALTLGTEMARLGKREVRIPAGALLHVTVDQTLDAVTAHIAADGQTVSLTEPRARGGSIRLAFTAGDRGVTAALTNLSWTEPVLVRTVRAGERQLVCEVEHPVADTRVTVEELDRSGRTLRSGELAWPLGERRCVVPISGTASRIRLALGSGPAALVCEIPVQDTLKVQARLPQRGAFVFGREGDLWVGNESFAVHIGGSGVDRLLERRSRRVLAAEPYQYRLADGPLAVESVKAAADQSCATVTVIGKQGVVQFEHVLRFPSGADHFEEQLHTRNTGSQPADLSRLRCGFVRLAVVGGSVVPELAAMRFIAVPLRHDPLEPRGSDEDFDVLQVLSEQGAYRDIAHAEGERARTAMKGSEGWLLQEPDGGILILTYCNEHLTWSLIEPADHHDRSRLVMGGFGTWHGDPEEVGWLPPGAEYDWGVTRWYQYRGDMRQGYYTFRRFMDEKGHGLPPNFNPPVHWNEIYDNKLWWGPDTPENRAKFYRLTDMLEEARKARDAHCEALYLDPGWDTSFGTHVWDTERLGPLDAFCRRMREEFGLAVSLHTPLADWSSAAGAGKTYPPAAWRVDETGNVLTNQLCSGSRAYVEEESRRLIELCRQGVQYLMFDGSAPTGPCYARDHGHPVPYTRDDHARAMAEIARRVRAAYPGVIIEQHDQVTAGRPIAYCPQYYMHGPDTWTERWGYEFMWGPLQDVLSGRALSLYYYNLAYSLPMYLHIDLRPDDEHCLAFWWYASTCRHLGIGGTHADGHGWEPIKRAMALYRELEHFFKQGVFYGLGEEVHAHTLPALGTVLTVFNLSDQPAEKTLVLRPADVGLKTFDGLTLRGCVGTVKPGAARLVVHLPARGVAVVRLMREPGGSGQ